MLVQHTHLISTHKSEVLNEAGLLRAAALNLGFGAVPQLLPQSRPTACKNNYEWMSDP